MLKGRMYLKLFSGALLLLVFACQKKEIKGPQGDPGTNGIGGNSNIDASAVFAIASNQWIANADSTEWYFTVNAPQVTADIASSGVVRAFIEVGTNWWELPYLSGEYFMQFGFSTGSVKLSYLDPHGEKLPSPATAYYRLVTLTKSARLAHPSLDLSNYNELMQSVNSQN